MKSWRLQPGTVRGRPDPFIFPAEHAGRTHALITIDGSQGEGGGQVLRSALALSMCLGRPLRVHNIRARRKRPGLMRQHLSAVWAAAQICGARVSGAELHSRELRFTPGTPRGGDYRFDIGTAGSTTLVLQTVLPALMMADRASRLTLIGGTHNPLAPPFDFIARAFLPLLRRMGVEVRLSLLRYGFYPAGGGIIEADIRPVQQMRPLHLTDRGGIQHYEACAVVANLPLHIARRELDVIAGALDSSMLDTETLQVDSPGPGNVVSVAVCSQNLTELFSAFGQRGVRAETVAGRVVEQVSDYRRACVPVGHYLADQLLLPCALAGNSRFVTMAPSGHTLTKIDVIGRFMEIDISCRRTSGSAWLVEIPRHGGG
jgi:RNA 3'-terminal phosphate cyclase (ATP)